MILFCTECSIELDSDNTSPDHQENCIKCYEEKGIANEFNKITSNVNVLLPLNIKYAQEIKQRFSIFAFNCSCYGEHPDCAMALDNVYNVAQMDTIRRICDWLERQDG